jgi:predicted transcriptional regulator
MYVHTTTAAKKIRKLRRQGIIEKLKKVVVGLVSCPYYYYEPLNRTVVDTLSTLQSQSAVTVTVARPATNLPLSP